MHVVSIIGEENSGVVLLMSWYVFFLCTGAIKRMLNLNNPLPKSQAAAEPVWKVLSTLKLLCAVFIMQQ